MALAFIKLKRRRGKKKRDRTTMFEIRWSRADPAAAVFTEEEKEEEAVEVFRGKIVTPLPANSNITYLAPFQRAAPRPKVHTS